MSIALIPSSINMNDENYYHIALFINKIKENYGKNAIIFHSISLNCNKKPLFFGNDMIKFNITKDDVIVLNDDGIFVIRVLREIKIEGSKYYHKSFGSDKFEHIADPFTSIDEIKYSLYNYFKQPTDKKGFAVGFGVAFTSMSSFERVSSAYNDENIYLLNGDLTFEKYLNRLSDFSRQRKNQAVAGNDKTTAIIGTVDDIKKQLIDLFQIKISSNKTTYTPSNKQREILGKLENGDGAIIHGGAGTGKTEIAIDLARRLEKNDNKVKYFTFNMLLCYEVKKLAKKRYPGFEIDCSPIKEFFIDYSKKKGVIEKKFDPEKLDIIEKGEFYNIKLPKYMLEALSIESPNYDVIIVDQAQDVIEPNVLMLISLMLKNRMSGGKWYFFGDFVNQMIYGSTVYKDKFKPYIRGMISRDIVEDIPLTENFRSSKKIIEELDRITGEIDDGNNEKLECLNNIEGICEYVEYDGGVDDLISKIDDKLDQLLIDNSKNNITILTNSYCEENELFNLKLFKELKHKNDISLLTDNFDEKIKLAKIRRYKGLENDIVLLVDLHEYIPNRSKEPSRDLLYTGISRAKNEVYIFENKFDSISRNSLLNKK